MAKRLALPPPPEPPNLPVKVGLKPLPEPLTLSFSASLASLAIFLASSSIFLMCWLLSLLVST